MFASLVALGSPKAPNLVEITVLYQWLRNNVIMISSNGEIKEERVGGKMAVRGNSLNRWNNCVGIKI